MFIKDRGGGGGGVFLLELGSGFGIGPPPPKDMTHVTLMSLGGFAFWNWGQVLELDPKKKKI